MESTYDLGDEITLQWTNTHADRPVDIERWDFVGSTWVKSSTLASTWFGNSGTWNTQGESQGETVKIRIQSKVSSTFIDSPTFSLTGTDDKSIVVTIGHHPDTPGGNDFYLGWDNKFNIAYYEFAGDVDIYFYDTSAPNQLVSIAQSFGQNDSTVCAQLTNGNCYYSFYPSNSFDGNNISALIPFLNGSDGEGFPSSGKKFRVCKAGTTDCVDSDEEYNFTGWSMNNSFYVSGLGNWVDANPTGGGGGTGSKYFWSAGMTSISVSTSGGTGDVDLYLYKIDNINTPNVTFTNVASSTASGNNETLNYSSGDGGWYILRLYPYSVPQGFTVTSTYTRNTEGSTFIQN